MKKLTAADYRSMPWKNGAGTTVEIAVQPPLAGLDEFAWRVSRAAVVEDGAFSGFAGIDRSLALLEGVGMHLDINGVAMTVNAGQNIVSFAGDTPTHATLIDGPIVDFNVMSRRMRCSHTLHHWTGAQRRTLPTDTVMLYCASGKGTLSGPDVAFNFGTDDAVLIGEHDDLAGVALQCSESSRFYCIQIHR
jgi:environmental stress-induced protein Ves